MNSNHEARDASCAQSVNLVAYLYDEATPVERNDFERHLRACSQCQDEVAAFGAVRLSIAELNEAVPALGVTFAGDYEQSGSSQDVRQRSIKKSLAALREFLSVSPRWLQVSGALAALALCVFATFGIINASSAPSDSANDSTPTTSIAVAPPNDRELEQIVDARVERELARLKAMQATLTNQPIEERSTSVTRSKPSSTLAVKRDVNSRQHNIEIAADEWLVAGDASDEEELPKLADLLDGV